MFLITSPFFSTVRIVIPLIRGNGTGQVVTFGRSKRSLAEEARQKAEHAKLLASLEGHYQPDWVRKHYRARRELPTSLESRILNKRKRFLRLLQLKEEEEAFHSRKKRLVPRQQPIERLSATGRKVKFVPRYERDVAKIRRKRQTFDDVAFNRMA